ncbi:hypothetical protein [Paenibacillus medicaginis]|uniref:Phage protein n=1 Tax=Paenibacillus medicaginis TaxID=1470560 RepID=A0ABV5C0U0_9BACL
MNTEEFKDYLDGAIRKWRMNKASATDEWDEHTAACYIDAFQSVRVSVFGETLPAESLAEEREEE